MRIFNTLIRSIEEFKPINKDKVAIYVCGITPYDTTHLGHAFTYISFDILIRFLKFKGNDITYTQNVTDINDRDKDILQRAKDQNIPWQKLTQYWTNKFLADMTALNWTSPTYYLKASKHLPSMTDLIQKLLKNKLAYKVTGSIYLDITKVKDFGKLSRLNKEQMLKTAKEFEEDLASADKINSLDITLWRSSEKNQPKHIPSFDSIFGPGRPGWHIECSAMSMSTLGEQIDIHGGGKDLVFPHHEAEIAPSEGATNKIPFARYWIHSGTVAFLGAKMSKSKGNLVMVSDILRKYSANAIRYLLLSNHWQSSWEYFEKDLKKAQKKVDLLENSFSHLKGGKQNLNGVTRREKMTNEFIKIMDNNLDTPKVLQFLDTLAKNNHSEELKKYYQILGFSI